MHVNLKEDILKLYGKVFREEILKQWKVTFDYLYNIKVDSTNEFNSLINTLQSQTFIELCHYNKKQFGVDEEIEIFAKIKNVPKMLVKVFEINTDNYFRKNMKAFTSDINLDGLIAKYEQEYNYQDMPSNLQHTEHYYFP